MDGTMRFKRQARYRVFFRTRGRPLVRVFEAESKKAAKRTARAMFPGKLFWGMERVSRDAPPSHS